ncbi:Mur ligase family protein [Flavobacteriales bacterium]|nr:Mur ligase family protein [Flavobacteriales bacterium]
MKVHLIAIGGSAMHNLALALHHKGFAVTGSDDAIFEPSKSRLSSFGLLPDRMGWYTEKIHDGLDAVILGMHARIDNPELKRAQALNIPIYSYPEYIYNQSIDKKRVVIGGSHGKTSITAMILHVLHYFNVNCDYMVGAKLDGFDTMVRLTKDAPIIILEGDEYLSSPIDRRPKFHWYKPHIAILSGIAWDHINVFPTFENYVQQFRIFKNDVKEVLFYCSDDKVLASLCREESSCRVEEYSIPEHTIENGVTYLRSKNDKVKLQIFGEHNLQNLNAARLICQELSISESNFYLAISSFKGASKRLELVKKGEASAIYKDFAHSPSKLKATSTAMKNQFTDRTLVACMELHTFSSLNKDFLKEYSGAMDTPDKAIVYFSKSAIAHKKLEDISVEQVHAAFDRQDLMVFTDSEDLKDYLKSLEWKDKNLLMMSSGNFDGIDFNALAEELLS